VENMGQLLLLLQEHDFPSTRIMTLNGGDIITAFQGHTIMMKAYIEGEVLENLDATMLNQVGAALATLHQIPAPSYLPSNYIGEHSVYARVKGCNIDIKYETWLHEKIACLEKNIPPSIPRALIHGDLFFDNVLFEKNSFQAIIDFEDATHYYAAYDLGMAIIGCCATSETIDLDKSRALVQGYQQLRSLLQDEKESLQLFVRYAATITSCWRFCKYNIDSVYATRADLHWQMVELEEAIDKIPKAEFLQAIFSAE